MDSISILWVVLSVLTLRFSAAAVASSPAPHGILAAARSLYLQHTGSPCSFDNSRPAASHDDNTGDEDDNGGNAAGWAALKSSVAVAAPVLSRSYPLPSKALYPPRTIPRELSSRAPPF
jgi:hypothetical protein